jgi:hypothetical protein
MGCFALYDLPGLPAKLNNLMVAIGLYSFVNCIQYLSIYRCVVNNRAQILHRFGQNSDTDNNNGMPSPHSRNFTTELNRLTPLAIAATYVKTLAQFSVFVWGNIAYFECIDIDCDSSTFVVIVAIKTLGLLALGFGYVFCGFMLIGVLLTLLSLVLYCPYLLAVLIMRKIKEWRKRRQLLVRYL